MKTRAAKQKEVELLIEQLDGSSTRALAKRHGFNSGHIVRKIDEVVTAIKDHLVVNDYPEVDLLESGLDYRGRINNAERWKIAAKRYLDYITQVDTPLLYAVGVIKHISSGSVYLLKTIYPILEVVGSDAIQKRVYYFNAFAKRTTTPANKVMQEWCSLYAPFQVSDFELERFANGYTAQEALEVMVELKNYYDNNQTLVLNLDFK